MTQTFSATRIQRALAPYLFTPDAGQCEQIAAYTSLLLKWNQKVNLTAVVQPDEILARHFGESVFAARQIPPSARSLLDVGSGAGFPGLPLAIVRPELDVTLLEPVLKKVAFLKEVARSLDLAVKVQAIRVEDLPPQTSDFDVITTRAVRLQPAVLGACERILAVNGTLLYWTSIDEARRIQSNGGFLWRELAIPKSENRVLLVGAKPGS